LVELDAGEELDVVGVIGTGITLLELEVEVLESLLFDVEVEALEEVLVFVEVGVLVVTCVSTVLGEYPG
jgi:hypothetical protein